MPSDSKRTIRNFRNRVCQAMPQGVASVIATVSGGADSVALLAVLTQFRHLKVTAANCNFQLRGEESERDQLHVERLCETLGVPLRTVRFDVAAHQAAHRGCSTEMACRELRYDWFRQLAVETGADRIATGHNADDNAETLLLNLFRGSGTAGLKGMAVDNGTIWRPLLTMSRNEILEYLQARGLDFVTDSSNLTSDYRRNFIRNELLPLVRTRWAGADKALARTLAHMQSENRVVEQALTNHLPSGNEFSIPEIMHFADPELAVRRFIEPLHPFTTTASEIIGAIKAAKSDVRVWNLPLGRVELRGKRLVRTEH